MTQVRNPFVAGQFYPDNPIKLREMVTRYVSNADVGKLNTPKAIIAPHAGYIYSGAIAGSAYKPLYDNRSNIKRVILLGPAHRCGFKGIAATNVDSWTTPIGSVKIDKAGINEALRVDWVNIVEEAYYMEHGLEVQLPFLINTLDDFTLVPLVIGEAKPEVVAGLLETIWGDDETLIVISSDLSHYCDYNTAKEIDARTTKSIENLDPDSINYEQACGRKAIQGLLHMARQTGLHSQVLDLRNSGDTAGSRDRVVGYGAYYFA